MLVHQHAFPTPPPLFPSQPFECCLADGIRQDSMQLADELPMIYTTCIMAYATYAYGRPRRTRTLIAVGLIALALWITIYYLMSQNPVFHQVAYAALTCSVVFRGMYVMEKHLRPALRKRNEDAAEGDAIMKQMWKMAVTGMSSTVLQVYPFLMRGPSRYCFVLDRVSHLEHGQHFLPVFAESAEYHPPSVGGSARRPCLVAHLHQSGSLLFHHLASLVGDMLERRGERAHVALAITLYIGS